VLVVEDDQPTRAFLLDNLIADGFRAAGASGVGEGLRAIEVRQPALVVLDLGLEDGTAWCCWTAFGRPKGSPRGSIQPCL
jgi:DNA-binding response OmpR family regulator